MYNSGVFVYGCTVTPFIAILRYVVWPLLLLSVLGPLGLFIWLFIH